MSNYQFVIIDYNPPRFELLYLNTVSEKHFNIAFVGSLSTIYIIP